MRREDDDGSQDPEASSCASPTGASPVSVSVGAPSSRSPEASESSLAEARRQEPGNGRQGRGPQHEVKLAASTESRSGSRAAQFTAKATSATGRSETTDAISAGYGAQHASTEKHGTREIRLHGLKSEARDSTRPMAKRRWHRGDGERADARERFARASDMDAPPESGNFDAGFASTAVQAARYAVQRDASSRADGLSTTGTP